MEHTLTAPVDGVVTLSAKAGDKVAAGQILATVTPSPVEAPPLVEVPPSLVEVPPSLVEARGAQATSLETS